MKISIIHPSRSRPEQARATQSEWIWRTYDGSYGGAIPDWEIEYITSLDNDDPSDYKMVDIVIRNDNKSAIEAINNAAKIATGDILMVVSDDTWCFPAWDKILLEHLLEHSDYCAKTNDGLQPTLITMPIMDRVYYERYGYIYHPDYAHMFCDQELTSVAIMTGKYINIPLLFPHLHYSAGLSQKDELNSRNDATWHQGQTLFNERMAKNFGIEKPVVDYDSILWR